MSSGIGAQRLGSRVQASAKASCDWPKLCTTQAAAEQLAAVTCQRAGEPRGLMGLRFDPFGKTVVGPELFHQDVHSV